jgi:nicotinamide mononucleotide transporter
MEALELFGAVIGLIYLYLEYKAKPLALAVRRHYAVVYIVIFYQAKFYADMCINIYYFFASIWGWMVWTTRKKTGGGEKITHYSPPVALPLTLAGTAIFALIAFILVNYTDSRSPTETHLLQP